MYEYDPGLLWNETRQCNLVRNPGIGNENTESNEMSKGEMDTIIARHHDMPEVPETSLSGIQAFSRQSAGKDSADTSAAPSIPGARTASPELADALKHLLSRYVDLLESAEYGGWSWEEDQTVYMARTALARAGR